ncbi:exonuclease GOR-like [Cherax quadricarinatus]
MVSADAAASKIDMASADAAASKIDMASADAAASKIDMVSADAAASKIDMVSADAAASKIDMASADAAASKIDMASADAAASKIDMVSADAAASKIDMVSADAAASKIDMVSADAAASKIDMVSADAAASKIDMVSADAAASKIDMVSADAAASKIDMVSADAAASKIDMVSADAAASKIDMVSADAAASKIDMVSADAAASKIDMVSADAAASKIDMVSADAAASKIDMASADAASKIMPSTVNEAFYQRAESYKLSESDLKRLNYPRPEGSQKGKAQLCNLLSNLSYCTVAPAPDKRTCKRCMSKFRIRSDGHPAVKSQCSYHVKRRTNGYKPYFPCCIGRGISRPCKTAPQHVSQDIEPDKLDGFIYTKESKNSDPGIYALDCEMVFTRNGMEVAAISMVDSTCKVVYETLVVPDAPIVDYNTEHSGLTEQDFRGVNTGLKHVHKKLLELVGSRTILVGHGLENDLLRLKVIHDNIIDTSILHPHPKGLPFRRALMYLKEDFLPYRCRTVPGIKCRGDADATMKLVRIKCGQPV